MIGGADGAIPKSKDQIIEDYVNSKDDKKAECDKPPVAKEEDKAKFA